MYEYMSQYYSALIMNWNALRFENTWPAAKELSVMYSNKRAIG